MNIIFSHGRLGKPNGRKIQRLSAIAESQGHQTHSIDYTDTLDPDERAKRLIHVVKQQDKPFVLVGSSMGGYGSLVAAESADTTLLKGIFLMAPALFLPRYQQQQFQRTDVYTEIVHGWHDSTVLFEHSVRYARQMDATLHLIDDNHQLSEKTEQLNRLFALFLATIQETT